MVSGSKLGLAGLVVFIVCLGVAVFAPVLAPYQPLEKNYDAAGKLMKLHPPSVQHPLGTTLLGRDVFSQVIWGARPALIIGLSTAAGVILIGVNIGLISGYYGGWIDNLLMRITDIFMGVPFLPFIIVMLSLTGRSMVTVIFAMVIIMWRSTARVIRSQVLTLRERPFVDAARISGASGLKIIYVEIAPNILPIALVNVAFALAWAIITEASIGFLGFSDPDVMSWGTIIYRSFASQMSYKAWWWVVPPGAAIMVLVTAVYFIGRAYEEMINPRLQKI
ncbi:MAG: ABC transporter permease [Desulfobacteraceae bacterium]|nr:ABC transporter permease [Desulfobacteraceae bacterium]